LELDEDLDYASKQCEDLADAISEMQEYVSEGYSIEEAFELSEDSFDSAVVEAAELIETQWYI
jgi:type II secretory pathway component PulF